MKLFDFKSKVKVHFIGIGGIGMSGIAEVLVSFGFSVSGSDLNESQNVVHLRELGVDVYLGHDAKNIKDYNVIVYSSAVKNDNPEMIAAKVKNIPIMRRAEMLAELMRLKKGIAIAGTHGKTTTTSLLATILKESQYDPTYIIGGIVANLNGHAKIGKGEFLVAEADESDGSFLLLNPIVSLITNIDSDHLDHYKTFDNVKNAFIDFANKVPFYGVVALNISDAGVREIMPEIKRPIITFGLSNDADIYAQNIKINGTVSEFDVYEGGQSIGRFTIHTPGEHNILNALGSIAISRFLGLKEQQIIDSICKFKGVGRRFQQLLKTPRFELIDDYGHHPTEVQKTISIFKESHPGKKLYVIFEPHRFSRTKDCWEDFLHSFNLCHELFLLPIYPASEMQIAGITSDRLSLDINILHPELSVTIDNYDNFFKTLDRFKTEDCVVLTLGAGSIGRKVREWVEKNEA